LIVVRGRSGTGKTTVAKQLAEATHITHLATDRLRQEMLRAGDMATDGAERYAVRQRERVYEELFRRAQELLAVGRSAILDGTFLSASQRQRAWDLARQCNARFLVVHCHCAEELQRQRIEARQAAGRDASEATWAIAQRQIAQDEADPPVCPAVRVDTAQTPERVQEQVRQALGMADVV
jgi:predicted kinase